MYEQILPWVGLGVLLLLCLPIPVVQKFVLEVSTWTLRLLVVGLLAAGAYLWFRPGDLPADVSAALADSPRLLALLPAPGSPAFALCAACWAVAALVPVLAAFDVARALAGRRLGRVRALVTQTTVVARPATPAPAAAEPVVEVGVPVLRPVERRTAAAAIASAGPRPVTA